jgi:hypothetical protein
MRQANGDHKEREVSVGHRHDAAALRMRLFSQVPDESAPEVEALFDLMLSLW